MVPARAPLLRYVLVLLLAAAASPTGARPASAQAWPSRPLTMVVPYAPGGSTDMVARSVAPGLAAALGQPVLIENMPGVGGIAGVSRVAKAAPDGYRFVLGNVGTHVQNQFLFAYPPYDAMVEFVPAALLADLAMLLATRIDLPVYGVKDLVTYIRANSASVQYASAGFGSPTHLACALMNAALGVEVRHVPHRGGSLATKEMLAGRVDYFCSNVAAIKFHVEASRLKALAVLSRARVSTMPAVPTAQEQGMKGFEASNWLALFYPSATPEAIVERLNAAAVATLADGTLQTKLRGLGAEPTEPSRNTQSSLATLLAAEHEK